MADQFERLLVVQGHDTVLDQLTHRRASLPERAELALLESRLAALDAQTATTGAERDALGARQADLEAQIEAARARRAELEKRMFAGQAATRDLQAMDEEVKHLARHVTELEDREIEVMEALEPLDAALSSLSDEHAEAQREAQVRRSAIAEAEGEIDQEAARERTARQQAVTGMGAELLERYEKLRAKLGGTGAARLVGESCGGCHLVLPAMEVDRIRKAPPDTLITCDQCGRILVR